MKNKILSFVLALCLIIPCTLMFTACDKKKEPPKPEPVFVSTDAAKLAGVEFANSADVSLTKTGDNAYKVANANTEMSAEQLAVYGLDIDWVTIRVRMAGGSTYRNGWVDEVADDLDGATSLKSGSIAEGKDVKPFILGARYANDPIWKIEVTTGETVVTYTVDFSDVFADEPVFVSTNAVRLSGVEFANSEDVKLTITGENSYKVESANTEMSAEQLAVYGEDFDWVAIRVRMAGGSTYRNGWVANASDALDDATSLKTGSIAEGKDVKPFVLGARFASTPIWKIEVTTGSTVATYTVDFSSLFTA